jgi:hypothetical protein
MVTRSVRVNPILDKFRGTLEDWNADVAPGIAAGSPPSLRRSGLQKLALEAPGHGASRSGQKFVVTGV